MKENIFVILASRNFGLLRFNLLVWKHSGKFPKRVWIGNKHSHSSISLSSLSFQSGKLFKIKIICFD